MANDYKRMWTKEEIKNMGGGVTEEQFEELVKVTPTDVNVVQDQGKWQIQLEHDSNVLSITDLEPFNEGLIRFKKYKFVIKSGSTWTYDGESYELYSDQEIPFLSTRNIDDSSLVYDFSDAYGGTVIIRDNHITITDTNVFYIRNAVGVTTNSKNIQLTNFCNTQFTTIDVYYPGGTPNWKSYDSDTIDLTTGKMAERTNLLSNTNIIYEVVEVTE